MYLCMFSEGNVYLIRQKLDFVLQMYFFDKGSAIKLQNLSCDTDFVILDWNLATASQFFHQIVEILVWAGGR